MEYLAEWLRSGRQVQVKTNTSDKLNSWHGRLVNKETPVEAALELELEQGNSRVIVIPWHAVEFIRVHPQSSERS